MIDQFSPPAAKIALFRSLFRGREDVYARRFESRKTGKSGYAPACANEWVRGICEKPRIKCAACLQRAFLPFTDDVVKWHLLGTDASGASFVAGVYPLLADESCYFLAADFDKATWQDDARAFVETCRRFDLPIALERSRSGRGAHVWLFFEEPVPAVLARRLGSYLLTETMERWPDLGFDSYDRLFPNQDTLPQGGFGNLIALPLQKAARGIGNSVFLDDHLEQWPDQWAFLASLDRAQPRRVEDIVREGERAGRILAVRLPPEEDDEAPWTVPPSRRPRERAVTGDLPKAIEIVLGNEVYVPKAPLPPSLRTRVLRLAAFQNPEFYRAQSMRLPTYGKPRIIACAEDHAHHVGLPRGCLDEVRDVLEGLGIEVRIRDERQTGRPIEVSFHGTLRTDQSVAAKHVLAWDTGVLAATTAFGKTVVAAWVIAQRGVNTLVLVHRQQLLDQWIERLSAFLDLPPTAVGRIGGGHRRTTGVVDVALIQSLVRKGMVDDCVADYGQLVVDECHHVSARSFEQVARQAKAKFVLGLSATVARKDGHHPIIFMQCGPVRHRVHARIQAAARPFEHLVLVQPTGFISLEAANSDKRVAFQDLYRELVHDEARNRQICADVVEAVRVGRAPLVLTERNEHLDRLEQQLAPTVPHLVTLRAGLGKKQRRAIAAQLEAIPAGEGRALLATGRYIGEGFDDARLDTLFLTLPISWRGTVAQYAGRLHRLHEGKRDVRVYDYADLNVPMLSRMFDRRCRGYEQVGYTVLLPASAIPGWPSDVPLPSDPVWKHDYSGCVRRLVRDGVGVPLARLFVQVARPIPAEAEGIKRARSATEAFLFERLDTLPGLSGQARLNEALPIAFDDSGHLEVDLLFADARVAIELDGPQHLLDPIAYRRDRRKDRLLQAQGYFVLRFLAEDVTRDLDSVLDSILPVLAARTRRR